MMRSLILVGSALLLCASANVPAAEDDSAIIRKCSERYVALLLKGDRIGLENLMHSEYQLTSFLVNRPETGADKAQAIRNWTQPGTSFVVLANKLERIRFFGDTAIETGVLSASRTEFGSLSTWNQIRYTRVWVKEGNDWRLAHEHL
jgi:ketosteroid isomerase-like protein